MVNAGGMASSTTRTASAQYHRHYGQPARHHGLLLGTGLPGLSAPGPQNFHMLPHGYFKAVALSPSYPTCMMSSLIPVLTSSDTAIFCTNPLPFPGPLTQALSHCFWLLLNARLWGHLDNEEIPTNKVSSVWLSPLRHEILYSNSTLCLK